MPDGINVTIPEPESITIQANGKSLQLPARATIGSVAEQYKLSPKAILVELNGRALLRSEWPAQPLCAGDTLEFIRVVAGG